jgi:hypothetical protein
VDCHCAISTVQHAFNEFAARIARAIRKLWHCGRKFSAKMQSRK